jgi:hypothetical protein
MARLAALRLTLGALSTLVLIGCLLACAEDEGGNGGGGTVNAGASGSGATLGGSPECTTSSPLDGGWRVCDGELFHRPSAGSCGVVLDPRRDDGTDGSTLAPGSCRQDNHCTERNNGYCRGARCFYICDTDADCNTGEICFCLLGSCIPAECGTDGDCAGSSGCVASQENVSGAPYRAACQTAEDDCAVDSDCRLGALCLIDGERRTCAGLPPN